MKQIFLQGSSVEFPPKRPFQQWKLRGLASLILFVVFSTAVNYTMAQSCSITVSTATANWSAQSWSCAGGGTAPTTNNNTYTETLTVNGLGTGENLVMDISFTLIGTLNINTTGNPTITIPAGVTVVINGNFTDSNNNLSLIVEGTLVVTGTLTANNNTTLSGNGSISGGTLNLGGGTTGCSGSCPGLSFTSCSAGGSVCSSNTTSTTYIWNGATSDWQVSTNWTPTRTTPASADLLYFNATGSVKNITNIPTESVGKIVVTGASAYTFQTGTSTKTLTLTNLEGTTLQIDNGSTLGVGNASFAININLPSGGVGFIGGQINLINGNLAAGSATLTLHTNSTPLARTAGQVSLNSSSVLNFGVTSLISGSTIVLPNSIFVSAPTISSLVVNRTNGATLGDQSITVNTSATFTLGDLNTNGAGRLRFGTSASNPTETSTSKIVGYSEMLSRSVTTGAVDFLGFSLGSGVNDVGSVNIVRRTGTGGINTFNSNQSIAASWDVISTAEPVAGRSLVFRWVPSFDNVTTSTNQFQDYIFSSGPGWTPLGALQNLTATSPLRQTASVTTTKLTDTFTVTDQSQILPVELISFNARLAGDEVELDWITASEFNNNYFTVERSSHIEKFESISTIEGQGTTKSRTNYSFVDENPLTGASYYRLKQTDFDGKVSYSPLRKIEYSGLGIRLNVFPNPMVDKKFSLELIGVQPGEIAPVKVLNLQGIETYNASLKADPGGKILTTIELDGAPSGIYFVIINASTGLRRKIIVP